MKNYDETVNVVFVRIDEYKIKQKNKTKIIVRTVIPVISVFLAVAIGIFAFKDDIFKNKPIVTLDDSTVIGEKDYIEPNDDQPDIMQIPSGNTTADIIGTVTVNGVYYVQYTVDDTLFTADKYLGDARDFEGTYSRYRNDAELYAELYTVKESANVMLVKLGNGGTVILGRVGEIIVDGKTYFSTQWISDEFAVDQYLGKAKDFEMIEVPYRESYIVPEDEIWTVQENSNVLFIKKSNGDILIYSVWE